MRSVHASVASQNMEYNAYTGNPEKTTKRTEKKHKIQKRFELARLTHKPEKVQRFNETEGKQYNLRIKDNFNIIVVAKGNTSISCKSTQDLIHRYEE